MLSAAMKMASIRASILSRRSLEGPCVGSITPAVTSLFIRHCQSQRPAAVPLQLPAAAHATAAQQPPAWLRLARNCSTQAAATSPATTAAALAPEPIRRLVRSICVCTTPAQLRWLAQTETAEDRLQQAEQLPELLDHLEYNLSRYAPSDVIKMLTYLAACRAPCQDLLTEVVPLLYNSLGSLAPGELVMLLSTYITGGVYQQELFAAVTEFVFEAVGRLSAMEVSEVAWSYAVADHYDDDEDLFKALADRAQEQLQDHSPESLAQLLWSMGMLRFRHDPLCEAAAEQLSRQVDQWPLSSIGLALWGMAEVQHAIKPEVFDRLTQNLSMRLLRYRTSTDGQQLGAAVGGVVRSKGNAVQTVTTSLPLLRIGRQTSLTPSGGAGEARSSSSYAWEEGTAAPSSSVEVETPFTGGGEVETPAEDFGSSAGSAPAAVGTETAAVASTANHVPAPGIASSRIGLSHAGPVPAAGAAASGPNSSGGDSSAVSGSNGTAPQPAAPAAAAADGAPKPPPPKGPMRRTAMMQAAILAAGTPGAHSRVVKVRVPSTLLIGYELVEIPALITDSIPFSSMAYNGATITEQLAAAAPGAPATTTITSSSEEGVDVSAVGSNGSSSDLLTGAAADLQQQRGFSTSASPSSPVAPRGGPASHSKDAPWHSGGRVQSESLESLPGALVRIVWSAAMLSGPTITSAIFRECFALLGLFDKEAFADGQLALLWATHMRVRELNHPLREAHQGLTDNYKLYAAKISRVAPGNLGLHTLQQPLAAACWLASTMHPDAQLASFSSWRYRSPAVLSHAGMVASVTEALHRLPGASHPLQQVTLDGCYQLPLVSKVRGTSVAWQVLPPADCNRNPPHGPMAAAMARAKGLEYRGYTVVQVPFHEWAEALEAGDPAAATSDYLQRKLAAAALPQPAPTGV